MRIPTLLISLALCASANAKIWMPSIFANSMILQRDQPTTLWGEAPPGERIQAILSGGIVSSTHTKADGTWTLSLPAQKVSVARTLTIVSKSDTKIFSNIAFGEVWLASGQSNMVWPITKSQGAQELTAQAHFPQIRFAFEKSEPSKTLNKDVNTTWEPISPKSVPSKSAVAYTFARRLHQTLGVPIGIIQSAVGGTIIEAWTPGTTPNVTDEIWAQQKKRKNVPTVLYNSKINGLIPYTIRGAIWYQGESNHRENDYADKLETLVKSWRTKWGTQFPFYFVQIMPFHYRNEDSQILPRFWIQNSEAERRIPNSAMLVSSDSADLKDIHPPKKTIVGHRLASIALAKNYGRKKLPVSGPRFEKLTRIESSVKITLQHANGLHTSDNQPPNHWELRAPDGTWHPATAAIQGKTITISSNKVPQPTAVRHGWHKLAISNLVNAAGWPTATFTAEL